MAPEVMDDALYDERADFWSVGCILYEALFGKAPTAGLGFIQLLKWFRKAEIIWPETITIANECKTFLLGLLKKNPKSRLTWPEIINHPYISNNLLILDAVNGDHPLTQALTASQHIKKEKQRTEIIFHRGKKMIDEAMKKCQKKEDTAPNQHSKKPLKNRRHNVIGDNESISSTDSVNAIIQTDLETDIDAPMVGESCLQNAAIVGEVAAGSSENHNFVIQRYTDNFAPPHDNRRVHVNERLANDLGNLRIGTMAENLQHEENRNLTAMRVKPSVVINQAIQAERLPAALMGDQMNKGSENRRLHCSGSGSKELERRKLSQNLENFSIRMGNSARVNGGNERKIPEETVQRFVGRHRDR